MSGPAQVAHQLARLEQTPRRLDLEQLEELLPHLEEEELDQLVDLVAAQREGWERGLQNLLRPANERKRRSAFEILLGRVRSELSRRRPEPPSVERVKGGWLLRSGSTEILLTFDPTPESEPPPKVELPDPAAPTDEPVAPAEPSVATASEPTRLRRKTRSELTGREWHSKRTEGAPRCGGLPDREF